MEAYISGDRMVMEWYMSETYDKAKNVIPIPGDRCLQCWPRGWPLTGNR